MPSGEDLKTAIKVKGLTIEKAATLLDMTRANLYLYINKSSLDDSFVKFVNTKLDISLIGEEDYRGKYIALLEKSLREKEKENQELKDTLNNVQASLDVILRNQSTMDATFQASIEEMAKHIAKDEAGTLLQKIYTAAAVIELDNRKMDNRLQIGNVRNL